MDRKRWRRLGGILLSAVERTPEERRKYLDRVCVGDASLRREVETLLRAHEEAGSFLGTLDGRTNEGDVGTLMAGRRMGSYSVVRELGRGGMGTVYLAVRTDEIDPEEVALKLLREDLAIEELVARFEGERQILAGLAHPNIARLLDQGSTENGRPYYVMDYVQGSPIDHYCDLHSLPPDRRLGLFLDVCSAVQHAHQRGVIHLDLKPDNILVGHDGVAKLLDFGIATPLRPGNVDPVRRASRLRLMTLAYASPEQIRGGIVTLASDLYSLGVLLYKLLTGHSPYRLHGCKAEEIEEAVCRQRPEKPSRVVVREERICRSDGRDLILTPEQVCAARGTSPRELRRCLSGEMDTIILRALRKDARRRHASVAELSADLRRCWWCRAPAPNLVRASGRS